MTVTIADQAFSAVLAPALEEMAQMFTPWLDTVTVRVERGEAGFLVRFENGEAVILAAGKPELFRALASLCAAVENGKTSFFLEQQTPFPVRGVMYDCSRNSVPTVATIKLLLRRMAMMGLNALMLYTEDTYAIPEAPAMGHYRGRYSYEEMRQIDDYAALLDIEVIPCIQTVAHLERFLRWPATENVRDDNSTLYVGKEETYGLIRNMLRAASAPVRSRRIHLGLDEAHGLGLGRRLSEQGFHDKEELMKEHLLKIDEICNDLGLRPMMWGDMLFRVHIEGNGYYDEKVNLPDRMRDAIPSSFQVFYWDYYHNDQAFYDLYIKEHQKLGIKPLFAGGVCSWLGMQPNLLKSRQSARAGIAACREAGLEEVFTTVWRDDGGEGMPGSVFPGIQMFAGECWEERPERCDSLLQQQCRVMSGMDYEPMMIMGSFDELQEGLSLQGLEPANPHKYLLWQDPLLGQFDCEVSSGDYAAYYRKKEEQLSALGDGAPEAYDALRLARALAGFLKLKVDLGLRMKKAYDKKDRDALLKIADQIKTQVLPSLTSLHELHQELWMKWYKPFGWEVQDIRYGGLILRLNTAVRRLSAYGKGDLDCLEELAQPRLTYAGRLPDGQAQLPSYNVYQNIATVSLL